MSDRTKDDLDMLIGNLPDSRPREEREVVRTPHGGMVKVFCISCGAEMGHALITTDRIIGMCDGCVEKHGGLPLPVVDEDYLQFRRKEA